MGRFFLTRQLNENDPYVTKEQYEWYENSWKWKRLGYIIIKITGCFVCSQSINCDTPLCQQKEKLLECTRIIALFFYSATRKWNSRVLLPPPPSSWFLSWKHRPLRSPVMTRANQKRGRPRARLLRPIRTEETSACHPYSFFLITKQPGKKKSSRRPTKVWRQTSKSLTQSRGMSHCHMIT